MAFSDEQKVERRQFAEIDFEIEETPKAIGDVMLNIKDVSAFCAFSYHRLSNKQAHQLINLLTIAVEKAQ